MSGVICVVEVKGIAERVHGEGTRPHYGPHHLASPAATKDITSRLTSPHIVFAILALLHFGLLLVT